MEKEPLVRAPGGRSSVLGESQVSIGVGEAEEVQEPFCAEVAFVRGFADGVIRFPEVPSSSLERSQLQDRCRKATTQSFRTCRAGDLIPCSGSSSPFPHPSGFFVVVVVV